MPDGDYPVQFSVDYPDRPLNRLTTVFRIFTAIPILILLATDRGRHRRVRLGHRDRTRPAAPGSSSCPRC